MYGMHTSGYSPALPVLPGGKEHLAREMVIGAAIIGAQHVADSSPFGRVLPAEW